MAVFSFSSIQSSRVLHYQAASLLLYQSVFDHPVGQAFLDLLNTLHCEQNAQSSAAQPMVSASHCLYAYGQWFKALAIADISWPDFLLSQILQDDNPFSREAQNQPVAQLSPALVQAARQDLITLQSICQCTPLQISNWVKIASQVAIAPIAWEKASVVPHFFEGFADWGDAVNLLADHYRDRGVGLFARFSVFRWRGQGLEGVPCPDCPALADIVGYDDPKQMLIKNTEFLLAGYPALNVLLYGSRGSGKSSLVKAIAAAYAQKGLRLIEVDKTGLKDLPLIVEKLREVSQKFILFVDDLSFEEDDEVFKSLKVVLEGSVMAKAPNVIVYATSNRRHLVREFFSDRPKPSQADEVHSWDTVQEKLSFSDRFGLTLTFEPANQDTYLAIVHHLAEKAQIEMETDQLDFLAKQWATRHNGRSGRTARQFIDFLQGDLHLPQS